MYDTPVASIRFGSCGLAVFYIHTDHLNTPRRITKRSTNEIVWRWDSDAFGTTMANENPSELGTFVFNLRFPGMYQDQETGLIYNYYRDGYDSATGRYTQSDPIGLEGGINTYAYALNNPISRIDPTGQDALAIPLSSPLVGPIAIPWWVRPAGGVVGAGLGGLWVGSKIQEKYGDRIGEGIDKICKSEGKRCVEAADKCFEECQPELGKGGRTNQGSPYRNCWVRCMKLEGCYKGDSPVE